MFGDGREKVKAYLYRKEDGRYSPAIYIGTDPKQIASFIVLTKELPQIVITDTSDEFELNTMYGYVDRCADQEFLKNKLLDVLIPMQKGTVKSDKVNILGWGVDERNNRDSVMIPFILREFGINLDCSV